MRLCSIASGSSGNCIYVGTEATHVLVDAGISGKRVEQGLADLGLTGRDIDAILITHEHSDHVSGLGVLCRRYHIPVYMTPKTVEAVQSYRGLGQIPQELFLEIKADEPFTIKDLTVNPMGISHDALDPVAYRFSYGRKHAAVCTDLGVYNDYTVECLKGMDVVLLEANHDVNMLQVGSYPYELKRRILSDRGHLSNENAGRLLGRILHDGLKKVVLGHLSQENNLPELAYETVRLEINMADIPYKAEDFCIQVAQRNEVSEMITF